MLDPDTTRRILDEALRNGGNLAEIYLADRTSLSLELEESQIERALRGADRGTGIRVFYGDTVAYAYTDDLATQSLLRAARAAASAPKGSTRTQLLDFTRSSSPLEFPIEKPFDSLSEKEKAKLLHRIDQVARGYDPRVSQVQAGFYVKSTLNTGGINPVSGDYSVAANGLWIDKGEVTKPVSGVTVTSTLGEILMNITAVADDLRFVPFYGSTGAPTIRIEGMQIGGK